MIEDISAPERTIYALGDFEKKLMEGNNAYNSNICSDYRKVLNIFQSEIQENKRFFSGKNADAILDQYTSLGQIILTLGIPSVVRKTKIGASECLHQKCRVKKCDDKESFLGISMDKSKNLCVCDDRVTKVNAFAIQFPALKYHVIRSASFKNEILF